MKRTTNTILHNHHVFSIIYYPMVIYIALVINLIAQYKGQNRYELFYTISKNFTDFICYFFPLCVLFVFNQKKNLFCQKSNVIIAFCSKFTILQNTVNYEFIYHYAQSNNATDGRPVQDIVMKIPLNRYFSAFFSLSVKLGTQLYQLITNQSYA